MIMKRNTEIFSITKKIKKIYGVTLVKYKNLKNLKYHTS